MSWKNALIRDYIHKILITEATKRGISISDFIELILKEHGYEIKKEQEVAATV